MLTLPYSQSMYPRDCVGEITLSPVAITAGQWSLGEKAGPMRKYEQWLGHWKPEYDAITRETELVLQV